MSTKPPSPLPFVKAPPPFTLPAVPSGTVTVQSAKVRAQLPRKEELALIPDVQAELQRFTDYAAVFGKTAPARAVIEQSLSSAYQWSTLRRLLTAWTAYALAQETESWVAARNVLGRLSSAFGLAVKTDCTIRESYPTLGQLFGVRATIAQRGAAVRKANAQAVSEDKPADRGAAGKRQWKPDQLQRLDRAGGVAPRPSLLRTRNELRPAVLRSRRLPPTRKRHGLRPRARHRTAPSRPPSPCLRWGNPCKPGSAPPPPATTAPPVAITPPPPAPPAPRADASLPPRKVFFDNPDRTRVLISPDGKRLGWLAPVDEAYWAMFGSPPPTTPRRRNRLRKTRTEAFGSGSGPSPTMSSSTRRTRGATRTGMSSRST